MANPVYIVLAEGSSCQLRGVTGTLTEGQVIQGQWNANWQAFFFDVEISGAYELWFDPNGGTSYSKDSTWSGATGKWVPGQDFKDV